MKIYWHQHKNLLVGFMVTAAAITFLVTLLFLLHRKGVFEIQYRLNAVFESGVGLREGADVQFNGVKIGRVEAVHLFKGDSSWQAMGKVVLRLAIDKKYQGFITDKSVAFALRDKNLVSDRVVNIENLGPSHGHLQDNDTIAVSDSRDIESVLSALTKLMNKTDQLLGRMNQVVQMSLDPHSTVGALLGSRDLYDRFSLSLDRMDTAMGEGKHLFVRLQGLEGKLSATLPSVLSHVDSTAYHLLRTSQEAEKLSTHANLLADQGEGILKKTDHLLSEGAGKLEQAGDLMDAVSQFWFIRHKLEQKGDYPLLSNELGP